jgi:cysteine synthase
MIYDNILQVIGKTPVVRLNRVGAGLPVDFYGKCDFLNPGGSLKDRVALRMVENLEKAGLLTPGGNIVEPTSGNTGIGLAMVAAVKGYGLTCTMSQKISLEKEILLNAMGASAVRTPDGEPHTSSKSQFGKALEIAKETGARLPNQYENEDNPDSHYYGTGAEIWEDFGESLDAVVIGVGTGGTLMGIARYLKEKNPNILIVGVEPEDSMLGGKQEARPFKTEGIGYDFIPDIFDFDIIDRLVTTRDRETFHMARRLIREEGLLVGGSSGAVALGMLEIGRELPAGSKILGVLPDGIRNYMTKFVSDEWMHENGFMDDEDELPKHEAQSYTPASSEKS